MTDLSTYAGQANHYAAVRTRLGMVTPPPRAVSAPPLKLTPRPRKTKPVKPAAVPYGAPFNFITSPSAKTIIAYAALRTGVSAADIVGPRRTRELVAARRLAIQLVHDHCPHLTFSGIGRIFNRDHTTILWSLGRLTHDSKSIEKPTFARYFTQLTDDRLTV